MGAAGLLLLSTCGTYTSILRVCDAIFGSLEAGLAVYKGGQVGYDMGGNFVYFTFLAFVFGDLC